MNNIDFYRKHKEKILYLFFGGLTTLISIAVFALFTKVIPLDELIANIISWIAAVFFAFITNRIWVFPSSRDKGFLRQMLLFYLGRVTTLIIEEIILFIFIKKLLLDAIFIKTASQIAVIVLNYFISKVFIFRK